MESIETESESIEPNLSQIKKLSQEGTQRIRKRQKLIKIADKSKDGWRVVAEYESDELASGSEDEKRLKKAREAASRKKRQKEQLSSDLGKKPRIALGADNQLFRGKIKSLLFTLYVYMCFGSACASYRPRPGPVAHGTCTHAVLRNPSIALLQARFAQKGLKTLECTSDGSCFFSSVAHQLYNDHPSYHMNVHAAGVEYVRNNRQKFIGPITEQLWVCCDMV